MTDISTYKLDAAFTSLADFDHCAKPPSLKEQAIAALHGIHDQGPTPEQVVTIRRALEALDD